MQLESTVGQGKPPCRFYTTTPIIRTPGSLTGMSANGTNPQWLVVAELRHIPLILQRTTRNQPKNTDTSKNLALSSWRRQLGARAATAPGDTKPLGSATWQRSRCCQPAERRLPPGLLAGREAAPPPLHLMPARSS
ncbi:MAG: hypothetical protein H6Q76_1735 [Firmicutes bacterium]|nr:hypothetical protein [Bacillota bacterium]